MKRHVFSASLLMALFLASLLRSQVHPTTAEEIESFDQQVASLSPVPNSMDISVDVIGLDIQSGSEEENQLSQVAAAGAGNYYPVQDAQNLVSVFTQVTTGAPPGGGAVGVGGGAPVVSSSKGKNWLLMTAVLLGIGCLALFVSILYVRRRESVSPGKIKASLHVTLPNGESLIFQLKGRNTTVGRAPDNTLVIDDPQVSAHHVELSASREGFMLRDLGSLNGTFVKGGRISESPLFLGDEIEIGSTRLSLVE